MIEEILYDKESEISTYQVECDICGAYWEFDAESWDELIQEMRDEKIQSVKDKDGDWEHHCLHCRKKKVRFKNAFN